jgi:hypothetical protein
MKNTRNIALILIGLLVVAIYAGLTLYAVAPVAANPTPVIPPRSAATLILPTAGKISEPTQTATRVVAEYPPTATPSSTPTFAPTDTPLPAVTPVLSATSFPAQTTATSVKIEQVVIISIDGLRPDALERADTPVLDSLRRVGSYHPAAQAVLPSVTLVNHASMLSGMSPEKHGINWNVYDPDAGQVNGPTLFTVARDHGLTTAMVVGKPKLEHLVLPGSVDNYVYAGFLDVQVVEQAVALVEAGLPDILFIHLPDVDSAGHATGWMSAGQLLAISHTDGLIGQVVEALRTGQYLESTLLIVTSDHGGVDKAHGGNSPQEIQVPWLAVGPGVPSGLGLTDEIVMYDTAATTLYALDIPIPERWDGRPVLQIFDQ